MSDEIYTCPQSLRKAIAEKIYPNMGISGSEVFISDGAQCDIARLQVQQNHSTIFSGN
jgi:LL-diaminopimelate aminotransferase